MARTQAQLPRPHGGSGRVTLLVELRRRRILRAMSSASHAAAAAAAAAVAPAYTLAPAGSVPAVSTYLETIGRTPMVRLSPRSLPAEALANGVQVLCKLEMQNPGGSLKDRIALGMIAAAEARGEIVPGETTIIDFTSGNTGIGYAMVAAAKGYACIVCMPRVRAMLERYLICRQFGAAVHLFNPALGAVGCIKYIQDLVASAPAGKYWWPNQLGNDDNPAAHAAHTGPEIWAQAGGKVDVFVHGIGTGGCIAGVAAFLKSKNPAVRIVALEPTESRVHVVSVTGSSSAPPPPCRRLLADADAPPPSTSAAPLAPLRSAPPRSAPPTRARRPSHTASWAGRRACTRSSSPAPRRRRAS